MFIAAGNGMDMDRFSRCCGVLFGGTLARTGAITKCGGAKRRFHHVRFAPSAGRRHSAGIVTEHRFPHPQPHLLRHQAAGQLLSVRVNTEIGTPEEMAGSLALIRPPVAGGTESTDYERLALLPAPLA